MSKQHIPNNKPNEVSAMDAKSFKCLGDLYGHDLTGWQIAQCHFLELTHGCMGRFPAIDADKKIIATLDKSALKTVWSKLERRSAKVTTLIVIANPASGVAFNLKNPLDENTEPLRILSAADINALCQKDGSVCWAPGLLQLTDQPVHDPLFA